MLYDIKRTSKFKKEYKVAKKRGYDLNLIHNIIGLLAKGETLSPKYRDHALHGDLEGCRECHVTPDWLLIYEKNDNELILMLTMTGTHADLYK